MEQMLHGIEKVRGGGFAAFFGKLREES